MFRAEVPMEQVLCMLGHKACCSVGIVVFFINAILGRSPNGVGIAHIRSQGLSLQVSLFVCFADIWLSPGRRPDTAHCTCSAIRLVVQFSELIFLTAMQQILGRSPMEQALRMLGHKAIFQVSYWYY